mgnify:FL=1
MVSTNELITLINKFSLKERLKIVEEVLRGIQEEKAVTLNDRGNESKGVPKILDLAGVMSEEEASVFYEAVEESRKIDRDEW